MCGKVKGNELKRGLNMRRLCKRAVAGIVVMLSVFLLCVGIIPQLQIHTLAASSADGARILFISSYSYGWDTVQLQIEGIKKGVAHDTVVDYEFMDTKRVNDAVSMQMFYDGLAYRLSIVEPYDAVILGDDAALQFALEYREDLFPGIPLIFEGVNDEELAKQAVEDPLITGILEKLSVEKNIELALSIYPEATRVVGIFDDSITGEAERKNFYAHAELFPELEFSEINTSKLTTAELKNELSNIEEGTILIYVVMTEDASGKQYTNKESIELIAKFASVPALRMVEGGIGWGVLGGNIVSMEQSGQKAAELAMSIIQGTHNMKDMALIVDSPNVYCIDEMVMEKFGISDSVLPEDTIFINHQETFFERNKEILTPVIAVSVVILVVVIYILIDNVKRRKLTAELEEARSYLEDASQHDFLTGLPNRSKFMHDLEETLAAKTPCTVIMVDIDNFKGINDTYGHSAGDEALQQIAARLKAMRTQLLSAYRFAGDEFILILKSDIKKITDTTAHQCLQVFAKSFKIAGKAYEIQGSVGIASYPKDTTDLEQLIAYADDAMYGVKKNGKNSYAYYQGEKQ